MKKNVIGVHDHENLCTGDDVTTRLRFEDFFLLNMMMKIIIMVRAIESKEMTTPLDFCHAMIIYFNVVMCGKFHHQ